ncbi:MAG: hypothetical protein HY906_19650 [Deltaproteobacteria bacterium]|nr:hypothetical protein [Deltaproteobacteria bacterium]
MQHSSGELARRRGPGARSLTDFAGQLFRSWGAGDGGAPPPALTPARAAAAGAAHRRRPAAAQLCAPQEGQPYALMRVHTVTLISADAAPCIHLRPIEGETNGLGAMPALLAELARDYGRTGLFHLVTTDAGNTACGLMGQVLDHGWEYCARIKSEHGDLSKEAERVLGPRRRERAAASYTDTENGELCTYHLWRYDLEDAGWLDWTPARQFLRVERIAEKPQTGARTVGSRFYVTSLAPDELGPKTALSTTRAHWRCEEETH